MVGEAPATAVPQLGLTQSMRLPFAVDSLACARVEIMLIPSYTAAALVDATV